MIRIVRSEKNRILLLTCGFCIGFLLEIVLVEKGKLKLLSETEPFTQGVTITCLILMKHKHPRYISSSNQTWLRHCDDYYIVDVKRSPKLGKQRLKPPGEGEKLQEDDKSCLEEGAKDGRVRQVVAKSGWSGLCKALHLTKPSRNQWLIIVPDSLVVLPENLKLFVRELDCDEGHYFGYALENYEADYNVLSAGILLSRGTVARLIEKFRSEEDCDLKGKYWKNEDLYLGKYLKEMSILPKDTRDEEGRGRFHGFNLNNILWPGKLFTQSDYSRKALHPVSKGFNCCSPFLITLDVSDPDAMHSLYFFLYKLTTRHKEVPTASPQVNKTKGFFWKDFLREEGYNETAIENMSPEEYYKIWEKKLPPDKMYQEMKDFLKNLKQDT